MQKKKETAIPRNQLLEWKALEEHAGQLKNVEIQFMFQRDPDRFAHFHQSINGLLFDYSKQRISEETLQKLTSLARACDLEDWRDKMFAGDCINSTEKRPALHTVLRDKHLKNLVLNDIDFAPEVKKTYARMRDLSNHLRASKRFTHVVNIGIGGSDLGASMICDALKPFATKDITTHFISNIDPAHLHETLEAIDPAKTLFIVTSKGFTTQETLINARCARDWMKKTLGKDDVSEHFIAVTQNVDKAKNFGIAPENVFPIWDWVGGRYSLWSAIGLSICISIGYENFCAMLDGARAMDMHFQTAPLEQNIPVLLGLIGIWNINFMDYNALAVMPYSQDLHRFPAYMQQLDMESNGKSVDRHHKPVDYTTGAIVLGETGTNGQHAFMQLLHQGTTIVPVDFIAAAQPQIQIENNHTILLANMIAQSKALMEGRANNDPHKAFDGNRPSNTVLIKALDPYHLGMLLALYEHKIFVQGIIWNINSFDQCGVELGKNLAVQILEYYNEQEHHSPNTFMDSSTLGLINYILKR